MSEPLQPDFSINLLHIGDAGSAFRTQNSPGEYQRRNMVDRGCGSEFCVQGNLTKVIHGKFLPGGGPATIIVMEFRFLSFESARRFRKATIELLFADCIDSKPKGSRDPEVVRIAPMDKNLLNKIQEDRVLSREINLSGGAGFGNYVNIGGGIHEGVSKSFKIESGASVDGAMRMEGRNKGTKNQATWNLLENSTIGDGIPSFLRSAILLKRKNDDPFIATIKIEAKVDRWHSLGSTIQNMLGKTPKDDPIIFDPGLKPVEEDIPTGMEIENLSAFDITKLWAVKPA